jgi:hypothetical protein
MAVPVHTVFRDTDNGVHFSPLTEGPGMGAVLFFRFCFFRFFLHRS